jgi:4-amino-4-deoxy-L-arabinose transferase-like glycosyltransferase
MAFDVALDRIARVLATPRGFIVFLTAYIILQFALRGYLLPCASGDDMVQLDLSSSLEWGYGTRNPPLYTWLVIGAQQVLGATGQSVTLVKFAAMFVMYLFLYLSARRVLGEGPLALLAALAPLAIKLVAWDSVTNYSHTVLATAMYAATFYALLRIDADGRPVSYAIFGVFLGLGLLSKYTFALFALALLAAALADRELRGRLLSPKAMISAVIALAIVAPYGLWMFASADSATALTRNVFAISAGQDRLGTALRGLDKFASGYLNFLFPLALLLPLGFARAFRPLSGATPRDRWMRILGLSFIIMTAVFLLIILGTGATQFRKHYILVFILLPIYFFARAKAAGFAAHAPARFTGVLLIVALLGLGAVTAKYTLEPGRCMRTAFDGEAKVTPGYGVTGVGSGSAIPLSPATRRSRPG